MPPPMRRGLVCRPIKRWWSRSCGGYRLIKDCCYKVKRKVRVKKENCRGAGRHCGARTPVCDPGEAAAEKQACRRDIGSHNKDAIRSKCRSEAMRPAAAPSHPNC